MTLYLYLFQRWPWSKHTIFKMSVLTFNIAKLNADYGIRADC